MPSKDTDTSSISTNTTRDTDASNGTSSPLAKPRRPGAPRRKKPSRPQVEKSTENISPRFSHASAPNVSPISSDTRAAVNIP